MMREIETKCIKQIDQDTSLVKLTVIELDEFEPSDDLEITFYGK